jgi:hypothetical protein
MATRCIVRREGGIPLEEWVDYATRSENIKLTPPRSGINPFTKKPALFHPAAGSASLITTSGECPITYKSGELIADAPDATARRAIEDVAKSLNAAVRVEEASI